MRILNNSGNIEVGATNLNYLKTVQYKKPEFKKEIIYQYGALKNFPLVEYIFGTSAFYTANMGQSRSNNTMMRSADSLAWAVMPNFQNKCLLMLSTAFTATTANNTAHALVFDANGGWMQANDIIMMPIANGYYQKFLLVSNGVASGTPTVYTYQAKLISSDPATVFAAPLYGDTFTYVSVVGNGSSDNSTQGSLTPTQPADIYQNFTTKFKQQLKISSSEAKSSIWYVGDNGSAPMWVTQKEDNYRTVVTRKLETMAWYGTRTYQTPSVAPNFYDVNTPYLTNAAGETIRQGDGVFAQIEAGFSVTMSIATYTNPLNYNSAITVIQNQITDWRIINGITGDIELMAWIGEKGYAWWQNAFKAYADQSGGGISLEMVDTKDGRIIKLKTAGYNFGGTVIHLKKCSTFDNPQIQTNYVNSSSTDISMESYQFVMMPASMVNGMPTIEAMFFGGQGFDTGFNEILIPGTLDPTVAGGVSSKVASGTGDVFDGYQIQTFTDIMFNVPNPKMLLWFKWIP
jgi:hypothetical protein